MRSHGPTSGTSVSLLNRPDPSLRLYTGALPSGTSLDLAYGVAAVPYTNEEGGPRQVISIVRDPTKNAPLWILSPALPEPSAQVWGGPTSHDQEARNISRGSWGLNNGTDLAASNLSVNAESLPLGPT